MIRFTRVWGWLALRGIFEHDDMLRKDAMTEAALRKPYKNPPIEEALVEFRFVQSQEWDLTIPGKLHQHAAIKDEYPGKPRHQKVLQAALQTAPGQPTSYC
jgi:hypothetical protein